MLMRQKAMRVLWPSFLVAAGAEMVFFAFFDPGEFFLFGQPLELSRTAIYSIGFFFLWGVTAVSSGISLYLEQGSEAKR
jgi:hypothetical protein